jgi:hypothetical protein
MGGFGKSMGGGSGIGSTVGGLGGAALGSVFPGVGTVIGGMAGSALGGAIGGQFDKGKGGQPTQVPMQMTGYDPYSQFGNQLGVIEPALRNRMQTSAMGQVGAPGAVGNLYVAPGQQQTGALGALENWYGQATPAFTTGVGQIEKTAGGGYLDPMARPEFQRLAEARGDIARQMFGEFAPQYSGAAVARGVPFRSSSREEGVQRGAERIGTQAAQDVAQAGWQQYAAERAAQDAAARAGVELAPGLAGKVFQNAEQLRAAEQAAGTAQAELNLRGQIAAMEGRLRAMGLDDQAIGRTLEYMRLRGLQGVAPLVGPSQGQQFTQGLQGMLPFLQGTMGTSGGIGPVGGGIGGMLGGGGGMLSNLFGGGQKGYGGTIYGPSGGWATPGRQE